MALDVSDFFFLQNSDMKLKPSMVWYTSGGSMEGISLAGGSRADPMFLADFRP